MLGQAEKEVDDLLDGHFCSEGHSEIRELIDSVNDEVKLREKEGQGAYSLKTLDPNGLNDNGIFSLRTISVLGERELLLN